MIEFFLATIEENRILARDAEKKRAFLAHLSISVAVILGVIIAFIGWNGKIVPLSILLIFIGIYGAIASIKLYERSQYHDARARKLRERLDELLPDAHIGESLKSVDYEHQQRYPRVMKTRLNMIWIYVHAVTIVFGIIATILCII